MHSANCCGKMSMSVRLSAEMLSKRLYISSKFFSQSDSPTILVFPRQTGWQYSDGNSDNGDVEYKGV